MTCVSPFWVLKGVDFSLLDKWFSVVFLLFPVGSCPQMEVLSGEPLVPRWMCPACQGQGDSLHPGAVWHRGDLDLP